MLNLSRKKLIFLSLFFSFVVTLSLSKFIENPYPQFNIINFIDSVKKNFSEKKDLISFLQKIDFFSIIFSQPSTNNYKKSTISPVFTQTTITPEKTTASQSTSPNQPSNSKIDNFSSTPTRSPFNNSQITPTSPISHPLPTITSKWQSFPSPQPTSTPKPTKTPKPTPTPTFFLTNPRPGQNIREVAEIVGKIMCVPPAMVYAIYDNEAGYLGPMVNANWVYYNTYQGSDPTDIPGSTAVFGVTQMMGDTWHRIKPYVGKKLGTTELSLNVTFDSMAAAAYHVGNISLAWKNKISCDDWPVDYILYGACRYNGACPANTFGQKQYYNSYTYSVCESYNEYGGKQKKCQ